MVEPCSQVKGRTDVEMLDIKQEAMGPELPAGRVVQVAVEEEDLSMSAITEVYLTLDALRGLKISLAVLRSMARDRLRGMETISQVAVTE